MKNKKTIIITLVALLTASIFLPSAANGVVPMVRFAGNAQGELLVFSFPLGTNAPSSFYSGTGRGMFSIMGHAYLPQSTNTPSVDTQGIILRENRLMITFGGQTINVQFRSDQTTAAFFHDISPYNDVFYLGTGEDLFFYGTFKNNTGTYNIGGTALILTIQVTFTGNPTPVWTLLIMLYNSDGSFLADLFWLAESRDIPTDSTIIPVPAAAVFGHSVDFTLP